MLSKFAASLSLLKEQTNKAPSYFEVTLHMISFIYALQNSLQTTNFCKITEPNKTHVITLKVTLLEKI